MTAEDFIRLFYQERKDLLNSTFNKEESKSVTAQCIKQLNLDVNDTERLKGAINSLLTDTFYSILLGLDGASSIGNEQRDYKIWSEDDGEYIGDLEAEAYEYFHANKYELKENGADFIASLYLEKGESNKEAILRNGDTISIQTNRSDKLYSFKIQFIERDFIFAEESVHAELYTLNSEKTPHIYGNIKVYKDNAFIGKGTILMNKNYID